MSEVRVFMKDIRSAKMCSKGARAFFSRHHLDWEDFLRNGINSDKLEATGDAMALEVVEVARGRKQ
jgi:hypothetical protein